MKLELYSIYWNSNNNQYFYVKDGSRLTKTNGIKYILDPQKAEQTLANISLDNELIYVGYISTNQRLYINKNTKEQYIKFLEPIHDEFVLTPSVSGSQGKYYVEYVDSNGCSGCVYRSLTNGTIQSLAGI